MNPRSITTPLAGELAETPELAGVRRFLRSSAAEATRDAYRADWRCFSAWCSATGREALPATPETVALFAAARAEAGDKAVTIERRLAAIAKAHKTAGLEPPTRATVVRETMRGVRRELGTARRQKAALVTPRLLALLAATEPNLRGARDRAVLSVGVVGGLRRSELAALDLEDVSFETAGALVTIRRSKTDQEGAGRVVEIPATDSATCPVAALRAWLEVAGLEGGALFREIDRSGTRLREGRMSDRAVGRAVKRLARLAGLDGDFGGHSLRAGFATSALAAGVLREDVQRQGGWKSQAVMAGYYRKARTFQTNYSAAIGL